jgi:arylsulfatase A-like enzyme
MVKIIFTALLVMLLFSNVSEAQNKSQPNIIVILVDDLGYGDLSCQGGTDIQTPNIDKLFEKGVKFKQFYANCTVCSPTRASLLTGRYPDMVGVPGVIRTQEKYSWGYLKENSVTLPVKLKEVGYKTALVGKWHLGLESPNLPNERGFDYFHGFLGDMMDDYYTHLREENNYMRLNLEEVKPEGHATDIFSDWAIEYLETAYKKENPFFYTSHTMHRIFRFSPRKSGLKRLKKESRIFRN